MSTCTNSIPGCGCNPVFQEANLTPPPQQIPVTPPPVPPTTYWNTAQTATATCPDAPVTVSYTVPAGTLSVTTNDPSGQATVNAQALAQAQAQANLMLTQGVCGVAGNLSGLLWLLPATQGTTTCSNSGKNRHDVCGGYPSPILVQATVTGNPGQLYTVTLRIRGIIETEHYSGSVAGTANGYLFTCTNGSQAVPAINDGGNEYALVITSPAQTYFLNGNAANPDTYCHPVDYSITVTMYAGATVKLLACSGDNLEEANGYFNCPLFHLTAPFQIPAVWTALVPVTQQMTISGGGTSLTLGQTLYFGPSTAPQYPLVVAAIDPSGTLITVKNLVSANVGVNLPNFTTIAQTWISPVSATDDDPTHPIGVLQPYDGQFVQMDVISIQ